MVDIENDVVGNDKSVANPVEFIGAVVIVAR